MNEQSLVKDQEGYDEKYDEAVALVDELGQASISLLQRYMKIGYNRAARIIKQMECEGIVGPSNGMNPRKILRSKSKTTYKESIPTIIEKRFFPLSTITTRINALLQPAIASQFWVKAEISSGRERGGSFYCDLTEADSQGKVIAKLSCTVWQRELTNIRNLFQKNGLDFLLKDGTIVGFLCSLQYSPQYGISLRVIDADPSISVGDMELKKREIITRLQKEGLFEKNKKCVVPMLPLRIGLITSTLSAAYNDFIKTLTDSKYGFKIYLADAMMQGDQTEKSIIRALDTLCQLRVDLILITRGGGSKTDLYYLDNESIARKIASCSIPVWTGIGHEIDTSVLDYVANKSFKTPTAIAEELVARFVQMQRQLDESANSLKTVWAYRLKNAQDHISRSITGINQGPRKLLDVTASDLRERAQKLSLRVKERISDGQIFIQVSKEKLRSQPSSMIQKYCERLESKRHNLESMVTIALSSLTKIVTGLRIRFERERFFRRLQEAHELNLKVNVQLINRFTAVCNVKRIQYGHLKDRLRVEKIQQRIFMELRSLNDKMATLKASDPQNALMRGFALVYRHDGKLIRSINDVVEKDILCTRLVDGTLISEITSKEDKRE